MKAKVVIALRAHLGTFNREIKASLVGPFNSEMNQKS